MPQTKDHKENEEAISYDDVSDAMERLQGAVRETPLLESPLLNQITNRRILIKAECLQYTGSFKFRGGMSAITKLSTVQKKAGVLAYSSGNHAQGVALAAHYAGVNAVILMPNDAPEIKIENTRQYGAEVILYDRPGGEDREKIGQELANERGLHLIKPYDNPDVMAGQGTCGIEIANQARAAGINRADVLVCCGGGGLSSGIAISLEALAPQMDVRPVEPEHYDDVIRSQKSGQREFTNTAHPSICDAIVTPAPGELTFPIIKRLCKPGITVSDEESLNAMRVAITHFKVVAEPGGSVALAAALSHSDKIDSDTVICVVSGGNADNTTIARALS